MRRAKGFGGIVGKCLTIAVDWVYNWGMNAKQLFEASILEIESKSIRAWAQTDHNKPLWMEICREAVKNQKQDPFNMAAYMVAVAMGM